MTLVAEQVQVVVLGASPTGLYAVREAATAGYRVAVVDTGPGSAFYSRHVRSRGQRFTGPLDAIQNWLATLIVPGGVRPVLVPTSDVFIEFIVERYQALAPYFRLSAVFSGFAAQLLDKKQLYLLCEKSGIETPRVWDAEDSRGLLDLVDQVPLPCLLKPMLIHRARGFLRGKKVLLASTREQFIELARSMPEDLGGWLVQEIVPGPESAITLFGGYVDTSGRPQQVFSARKLRQYPPGFGSASLVVSEHCEETEAKTLAFLEEIGFQGVCGAEFKRDPRDGLLKMIEINPRPTLWFQVSHDADKRIVAAMVADLLRGSVPDERPLDRQVLWRYALKDVASAFFYARPHDEFPLPKPEIRLAASKRKRSWPVFAFDDPLPALLEPVGYLRKLWRRR